MNFLTHYYCDSKKGDSFYNLGLAIPDLMGMFKRGWKINDKIYKQDFSGELISIADGIRQHLQADQYFHQSEFFLRNTNRIKRMMVDGDINYRGTHFLFLSHILLEICIDRRIVIHLPKVVEDFYTDLTGINHNSVINFFNKIGLAIPEGFFIFYERFSSDKFLYGYNDIEKLIFMYNRILTRVNMTVLDPDEYEKLSKVIESIDALLAEELPDKASFVLLTRALNSI